MINTHFISFSEVPFPIFSMNKRVRQPVTASPFEPDQDSHKHSAPSTYGDFTKQLISTSSQRPYTGSHHKDHSNFLQQSYPGQNPRNYQNSQNHLAQNQQNHPSLRPDVMRSVPQGSTPYTSRQGNSLFSRAGSTPPVNSMETLEDSFPSQKTTPTAAVKVCAGLITDENVSFNFCLLCRNRRLAPLVQAISHYD